MEQSAPGRRLHLFDADDASLRPLSAALLERPALPGWLSDDGKVDLSGFGRRAEEAEAGHPARCSVPWQAAAALRAVLV